MDLLSLLNFSFPRIISISPRVLLRLLFITAIGLVLTACATHPPTNISEQPGFFYGLLHGLLIMFSLIGSLFMEVRIYAYPNAGFLYDIGYFIGVMMIFSSGAGAYKGKSKGKDFAGNSGATVETDSQESPDSNKG